MPTSPARNRFKRKNNFSKVSLPLFQSQQTDRYTNNLNTQQDAQGFLPQPMSPKDSKLAKLESVCSDMMDPISMDEFSDLSLQELENIVPIGSGSRKHCFMLENLMGHIKNSINNGLVKDPLNPNHILSQMELADVYEKMRNIDPTFTPPVREKKQAAEMSDLDRDALRRIMQEGDHNFALNLQRQEEAERGARLPQLRNIHDVNANQERNMPPPVFRFANDLPVQPLRQGEADYEVAEHDQMDDPRLVRTRQKVDAITKMPIIYNDNAAYFQRPQAAEHYQHAQHQPQYPPLPTPTPFTPQPQQPPFRLEPVKHSQPQSFQRQQPSVQPQTKAKSPKIYTVSKKPETRKGVERFFGKSKPNLWVGISIVCFIVVAYLIFKRYKKRSF